MRFFISYSTRDEEFVDEFYNCLLRNGDEAFKYNRESSGGNIWEKISDGIDWCNVFYYFPPLIMNNPKLSKKKFLFSFNVTLRMMILSLFQYT